eukprot:5285264-Pleurochrysis_carterae.AAC.1
MPFARKELIHRKGAQNEGMKSRGRAYEKVQGHATACEGVSRRAGKRGRTRAPSVRGQERAEPHACMCSKAEPARIMRGQLSQCLELQWAGST